MYGLGCTSPRAPTARLHEKLNQCLKIGSMVCKPSRSPRFGPQGRIAESARIRGGLSANARVHALEPVS